MTGRQKSAVERWLESQQAQEGEGAPAPSEFFSGSSTNFLPPDRRRSFTTPAGVSAYSTTDPFPSRQRPEDRRLAQAQLAREVEARSRLSGSSTIRSPRADSQRGWRPVPVRDQVGRLRIDWSREVGDDGDDGA
jgi:hypothetical protein